MNVRIAHLNAHPMLDAIGSKARAAGQVHQRAVGSHQPQISAAARVRGVGLLIPENRNHGKKGVGHVAIQLSRNGWLGDEDNRVGQGNGRAGDTTGERCAHSNCQPSPNAL